jgi:SAM-dependent methyltransferase
MSTKGTWDWYVYTTSTVASNSDSGHLPKLMTRMSRMHWTQTGESRHCPVCGGLDRVVFSSRMQYELELRTVVCRHCSLVYTDPPPRKELYERFYVEAYADFYGRVSASTPNSNSTSVPQRIGWQLRQIESMRPLERSRLMEIGPGKGAFLWWARQRGAEVMGLEPSREFAQNLRSAGLNVIEGKLGDPTISRLGKFDIVAMFHVLEHFFEPVAALKNIRDLLAPDGLLVIEVPNILRPFRSLDRFFLRYVHLFQYSPATLCLLLGNCQFSVLKIDEGIDDWRSPQSLFVIASLSGFGTPSHSVDDPQTVIAGLRAYRRRWALYGALRWHAWRRAVAARSIAIRLRQRMFGGH